MGILCREFPGNVLPVPAAILLSSRAPGWRPVLVRRSFSLSVCQCQRHTPWPGEGGGINIREI